MARKSEKKELLRQQIISAAKIYSRDLAGKTFLYVYGDESFEILFQTDQFLHLTGVDTRLGAKSFYQKSKKGMLDAAQFFFSQAHPMGVAKKKLPCLNRLPELTNTMVCVLKDLHTVTLTYTIGVTNLAFTLGLTANIDSDGKKINDYYLPRTLRVKDKSVDMSRDGDIVDFIFVKDASTSIYTELAFRDESKAIPESISKMIDSSFYNIEDGDE